MSEPEVSYTGNGTAGREADVRPTGFFFQMPEKIGSYRSDNPEHQKLDLSLCNAKRVELPVGEVYGWHGTGKGHPMCRFDTTEDKMPVGTKLYTSCQAREWVGLTDQEIDDLWNQHESRFDYYSFSCAIEAKLKEKNT